VNSGALPIVFTGRLLGYFRVPDHQMIADTTCPAIPADAPLQVSALHEAIQTLGGETKARLLLGLGDNFSPDLASRFIFDTNSPNPAKRKDVLGWDGKKWVDLRTGKMPPEVERTEAEGQGSIPMDNVACFLQDVGYDALVPGKHDFYFGPERLRELALLLAGSSSHTAMLGANLAIRSAPAAPQRSTKSQDTLKVDLPDAAYPWIQRFTIRSAYEGAGQADKDKLKNFTPRAIIVGASNEGLKVIDGGIPSEVAIHLLIPQACLDPSGANCGGGETIEIDWSAMRFRHPDESLVFRRRSNLEWLDFGNHRIVTPAGAFRGFQVERAFFQFPDPIRKGRVPAYVVKTIRGERAAVFGVVDPSLKENIGLLNYSWLNVDQARLEPDPSVETQLAISDPVAALDQILDACEADDACAGSRKIVLAQMGYDQAQLLAGKFRYRGVEIVLAETDQRHAAVDQERTQADGAPVVLSPGGIYDADTPNELRVRAYKVVTEHVKVGEQARLSVSVSSELSVKSVAPKKQSYPSKQGDERTDLQKEALKAMRRYYKADLALLQKRDLFNLPAALAEARRPGNPQQAMDAVFWKGDFLVRIDVTGDSLKSLMDQSDKFDAADANTLNSDLGTGRGLLKLGISQDNEKNWLVDGQIIDPGRLYSVATTDYLAYGDTGYVGLKAANLPRLAKLETLVPLSEVVCRAVTDPADPSCGSARLDARQYFDLTLLQPPSKAQQRPFDDLQKWIKSVVPLAKPIKVVDSEELQVQNHPLWSITLEKADISYSIYQHTPQSQAQLKNEFAGIPQTQVLTANSFALGHDFRLRFVRSGKHIEKFILAEDAYEHDYKQSDTDALIESQPNNLLAVESGFAARLVPERRALPAIKLMASVRAQTNFAHPLTAFNVKGDPGGTLVRTIDRLNQFPLKLGIRLENRVSWLESGYQFSRNTHSPTGYDFFVPETGFHKSCPANSATQPLSDCVADKGLTMNSVITENTTSRNQPGVYLNFKFQVPILHYGSTALSYVMENSGTLYLHTKHEYSLDPRYLETWTHSFNFKLPVANLSLVPKLTYLFYKNLVDRNTMSSMATSVGLQYNFTWHSGMKWNDALSYQDPSLKPQK
jgi:hypothetical protein